MGMRGRLVVLEGIDKSGKSTQSKLISEKISPCFRMSFPNRNTVIASTINSYLNSDLALDDHSIHLLFSANRWECKKQILDMIYQGHNVVLDRYAFSGVVYSAAKGIDVEWCKASDAGLPMPDLVVYMKVLPEQAAKRSEFGQERYEKIEFQKKVMENYEKLLKNCRNVVEVDACRSVEEVNCVIMENINRINASEDLGVLW